MEAITLYQLLRVQKDRSYHLFWLFVLAFLMGGSHLSMGQTYPVQANLFISPPYSVYLSDYTTPGSTRLNLTIFLADLSRPNLDVRFRLKIEGAGIEIKTKTEFIGTIINLMSGVPRQIYGDELAEYFKIQNLDLQGVSRSQLERTGALPEGIYRFTLEVLEYNRGVQISNSAVGTAWLILNDPPIINLPLDGEIVAAAEPQTVRFQWTPRHKGSPNASFSTEYLFRIVEIWPTNRNPYDAINTSTPIYEVSTTNNYLVYGLAEPPLIPGRKYAFQIQAKAISGIDQLDLFKNSGNSVVRSFTFGESCEPPAKLSVDYSGNTWIGLNWDPEFNNSAFLVRYKEDTPSANWFDKFSYVPNTRLDQLKPGTSYNITVQARCGTLESEESKPIIVSTPNWKSDFTCGNIDFVANLSNKVSIGSLEIDDQFYAGDFEITLDSIALVGGKFSGTGIASFPFLNFVKAKVRFQDVLINTDYKMFAGVVNTIYNPNSSMMYDMDGTAIPDSDTSADEESDEDNSGDDADEEVDPAANTTNAAPTEVDSVYTNDSGEVIIVIDGEETVVELPPEGEEIDYTDSEGNQISVDSSGNVTSTAPSGTSASSTSNDSSEDQLKFVFGPIVVSINENQEEESSDNCTYTDLEVTVEITLEDIGKSISKSFKLELANFSYTKDCETDEIISAKLSWLDESGYDIGSLSDFSASVSNLSIEIDKNGVIEGVIVLQASLKADKKITNMAILRAGVSGSFKYEFVKEGEGYLGGFDFGGIGNINLDLVKQNKVLASLQNGYLDSEGLLTGKIRLIQEIDYQSSQVNVKVKKLNFNISYGLNKDFTIETGSSTLLISGINLLEGELKVIVDISNNISSAIIEADDLKAFGMTLTDLNLKIDLDSDLDLTSISGSLIATHPDFGVGLEVDDFFVNNGTIEKLSFSGEINYKEVKVVIQEAKLDSEINSLLLSAYVQIEADGINIAAEINDFTIDKNGLIGWGGFDYSVDGVRTFGPLTVSISGESTDNSGIWRATTAKASLSLELDGALSEPLVITDATISYLKHKSKNRYKEIKLIIDDVQLAAPNIGPLQSKLTSFKLEIITDEKYLTGSDDGVSKATLSKNSNIKFNLGLTENVKLGKLIIIQSGVSGVVKYNFNGTGLEGTLDYRDVENINILVKTGESIIASLTDATIPEDGILVGTLSALPGASFNSGGFSVEVEDLAFNVKIPFGGDITSSKITSGTGKFNIANLGNINGSLSIDLIIDEASNMSARVLNTSEISAFGMSLTSFDLEVDLQEGLQIASIKGQLEALHPEFNAALKVSEFSIEAGQLTTFNFDGKILYKGFNLDLQKVDYRDKILVIDGKVAINITGSSAWIAVEELSIAENGEVTIRGVSGELDKSPVFIAFSASLEESRFAGTFSGEMSGIGLEGKIDIGVEDDEYNFAYLELTAKGNIPLGGTGLKLTKLGGQLGYNYALKYDKAGEPSSGNPQEGNYVVGLTLGLADVTNMIEVTGNSVVQFGNNNFDLLLSGSVNIPKQNSIATGTMVVHYALPDNTLDGSLAVDVLIPSQSGKLLNGNFDMSYAMGGGNWSVSSTDISAKVFSEIDFSGNIAFGGTASGEKFSGNLSGYSSYEFAFKKEFEMFEASLVAELDAGFNFQGNIAFDESGAEGDVMLNLYANGELGIVTIIGGYSKLIGLTGSSLAQLSFNRESAVVVGQMQVAVFFLGFEHDVDIDIEKRI